MKIFDEDYHSAKNYTNGTHRHRSPADTLAAYRPLMPRMGITRLANVTGLDFIGIPVYMCVRPNSRNIAVSQGKGLTHDAARASALMESIEIWHAERIAAPLIVDTVRSMARRKPIVNVDKLNLLCPQVPRDVHLRWIEGFDIMQGARTWVPLDLIDLDSTNAPELTIFEHSSNGLSSGNHLLEAINHGLGEVIERDATTMWTFDKSDSTGIKDLVNLETVTDPDCRMVIEKFRAADLSPGVYDITSDVGIPTYQAFVVEPPHALRAVGDHWGWGTHPSPAIALLRALTEVAQTRLTQISGSRDDTPPNRYTRLHNTQWKESLSEVAKNPGALRDFGARPSRSTDTFEGDVEAQLQGLQGVGLDSAVVVVLTNPELGIPVVKVIVPGLEGMIHRDREMFFPGDRLRKRLDEVGDR